MTTVTCLCLRPMQQQLNADIWNCSQCGVSVTGLELAQGIDLHSKMVATVRAWWRTNGVAL